MVTPALASSTNWDTWQPGSEPAARQARAQDRLISQAVGRNPQWSNRAAARGSNLASIEDHRLDKLSNAVSEGVARGDSTDTLARTLRGVLDDPAWAEMVATTEMNRAMTAASLETYAANGITAVDFLSAEDDRVCLQCSENEDDGPYLLNQTPPNGWSPVHPLCRCAPNPVVYTGPEAQALLTDLGAEPGDLYDEADAADLGAEGEGEYTSGEIADEGGEEEAAPTEADETPGPVVHDTAGAMREVEPAPDVKPEPEPAQPAPDVETHDTAGAVSDPATPEPESQPIDSEPATSGAADPYVALGPEPEFDTDEYYDWLAERDRIGREQDRAEWEREYRERIASDNLVGPATGDDALASAVEGSRREPAGFWSSEERSTFLQYKGQLYGNLNDVLRRLGGDAGYLSDSAATIDGVMARSPLLRDVQVDRALRDGRTVFGAEAWNGSLVGAEWAEYGYMSTTADPGVVGRFHEKNAPTPTRMVIRVPVGTHAVELSGSEYESELMLERGLSLRVVSDSGPGPDRVLGVEVVPRG